MGLSLSLLMTCLTGWLIGQGPIPLSSNLPAFVNPQTVWTQETIKAAAGLGGVVWLCFSRKRA